MFITLDSTNHGRWNSVPIFTYRHGQTAKTLWK